jgi:hypothetical protein
MLNTDQEAIERKVEMMNKNRNIFIKTKGCAKKKRKQNRKHVRTDVTLCEAIIRIMVVHHSSNT